MLSIIKILPSILLIFLFTGCASYHDGYKKGIFLKNDIPAGISEDEPRLQVQSILHQKEIDSLTTSC
jgi:hypothetical protein